MPQVGQEHARSQRGFTLIEVMIALVVFAIGMVTLSAMQLHSVRGANSGRHTTDAAAVAESRMEQLQRLTWDQLAPTGGWFDDGTESKFENDYQVEFRVANLVANWTRTIDVRVTWDDPKRPGRSVVLSSVRFNREGV